MSDLRLVEPGDLHPADDLVEVLERFLARARAGELHGLALAAATDTGAVVTEFVCINKSIATLAAVAMLNHRVAAWILE